MKNRPRFEPAVVPFLAQSSSAFSAFEVLPLPFLTNSSSALSAFSAVEALPFGMMLFFRNTVPRSPFPVPRFYR